MVIILPGEIIVFLVPPLLFMMVSHNTFFFHFIHHSKSRNRLGGSTDGRIDGHRNTSVKILIQYFKPESIVIVE